MWRWFIMAVMCGAMSACSDPRLVEVDGLCEKEACPSDASSPSLCQDECPVEGAARCVGGFLEACRFQAGGCLGWEKGRECPSGICDSLESCRPSCVHHCATLDALRCLSGELSQCLADAQGCRRWRSTGPCPSGVCADAQSCQPPCAHQCPSVGATSCMNGEQRTCTQDSQGCRAWSVPTACASGLCADGQGCQACPPHGLVHQGVCYEYVKEVIASGAGTQLHSMAMDSAHRVHVSYFEETGGKLWYRQRNAAGWNPPVLIDSGTGIVNFNDLALDSGGNPVVVYSRPDPYSYGIKYARLSGHTGTLLAQGFVQHASGTDSMGTPRIAIDSSDVAHVIYHDGYDHFSHYARGVPSGGGYSFTPSTLSTNGETYGWARIGVGPNGLPQVAETYAVQTGPTSHVYQLVYGKKNGGAFFQETRSTLQQDIRSDSLRIVVDAHNDPHLLYQDGKAHQSYYAKKQGSTWTVTPLGSLFSYYGADFAFDAQGKLIIGWAASGTNFGWFDQGQWVSTTLSTPCGNYLEMALGPTGLPHFTCGGLFYLYPRPL